MSPSSGFREHRKVGAIVSGGVENTPPEIQAVTGLLMRAFLGWLADVLRI